jgi:hypothetical protein
LLVADQDLPHLYRDHTLVGDWSVEPPASPLSDPLPPLADNVGRAGCLRAVGKECGLVGR